MLKTCQTLLYKIQVLWVKTRGWGWDYLLISCDFGSTPSTCFWEKALMSFFSSTISWNHFYRHHQDVKGLPDAQKLCIKTPPKTEEVCLALGLDSQQTSRDRGRAWRYRSTAIADPQSRDSNTLRDQKGPGVFWRLYGKLGTESRFWHVYWWNCQWLQIPLTHNSYNNLHQLKTCPQESCHAALCSYC